MLSKQFSSLTGKTQYKNNQVNGLGLTLWVSYSSTIQSLNPDMNTLSGENTNGEVGKREPKRWSERRKPTHTLFTPQRDLEPTSLGL